MKRYKTKNKPATWQYKPDYGLTVYSLMISLYYPETHPTWLPIFTACQPLKALTTYRFLDEGFVKSLAFMLTEEMDNCAEDLPASSRSPS